MANSDSDSKQQSYVIASNRAFRPGPFQLLLCGLLLLPAALFVWAYLWTGQEDAAVVTILNSLGVGFLFVVIQILFSIRSNTIKTTHPNLDEQVEIYRQLKDQDWESAITGLMVEIEGVIVEAARRRLANPRTWGRKQGYVRFLDGLFSVTLAEHNGVVGSVRVKPGLAENEMEQKKQEALQSMRDVDEKFKDDPEYVPQWNPDRFELTDAKIREALGFDGP